MYNITRGAEIMKRKMTALFLIVLVMIVLVGCDSFTLPSFFPTFQQQTTQTTTRTIDISGTISIGTTDYETYNAFLSPAYGLDVDQYNDILINTRDKIRRANIKVQASLYEVISLYPFAPSTTLHSVSKGSGFIYREDDDYFYAVTNYHVVDPEGFTPEYEIMTFSDTLYQEATLVAYDEVLDLAVLRFPKHDRTETTLLNIVERSFTKISPGELVLAVGNPLSVAYNVTFGEFIDMVSLDDVSFQVIYHSATIHEGSSGGALVDVDGNLIGVNTWGAEGTDEVAYAVPVSILYMFLHNNDLLP